MHWLGSKVLKSSQDTTSTSEGSDVSTPQLTTDVKSPSNNQTGEPPELNKVLPSLASVKAITKPSKDADLPVDILLLTVRNCEFLACYSELKNPYKCWFDSLGYVYFSDVSESPEELKVALLRCYRNGIGPGGALLSVKNAASLLHPKAVISVGTCSGLNPAKSKLGDVVACVCQISNICIKGSEQQSRAVNWHEKLCEQTLSECHLELCWWLASTFEGHGWSSASSSLYWCWVFEWTGTSQSWVAVWSTCWNQSSGYGNRKWRRRWVDFLICSQP